MKKIFSFIAGVAAAMSLQAASYTEAVQITMTCAGGPEEQDVILYVDPAQASVATVANMATTYEDGQVNFYVADGANKYSEYKANAISNLPVAIVTNRRDVSYTFTFNAPIATEGLVLTDLRSVDGIKHIAMTNGDSYTFSVADETAYQANKNITIADRFVINYVAPAPTCTTVRNNLVANRYYTICLDQAVTSANGASFWNLQYRNAEGSLAYLVEAEFPLVAGRPYIFQAEAEELCVELSGDPVNGPGYYGALYGTFAAMDQDDLDHASELLADSKIYLLFNNELWRVDYQNNNSLAANRAYVVYNWFVESEPNAAPGRRVRAIPMQTNGATAFENVDVEAAKAVKFMEDGKIFIKRGDVIYNLQGQLVK